MAAGVCCRASSWMSLTTAGLPPGLPDWPGWNTKIDPILFSMGYCLTFPYAVKRGHETPCHDEAHPARPRALLGVAA